MKWLPWLMLVGCSSKEPPSIVLEDFVTPDVMEARETWVDKASGLMFTTPDQGWTRWEAAELAAVADAKLGVREGPKCSGYALMRPANGVGARAAADAARAAVTFAELAVHVDEDVLYNDKTARRYEVVGKRDGVVVAERASFWLDLGNLYGVVAFTSERNYTERRRCLDRVTGGFAYGLPSP